MLIKSLVFIVSLVSASSSSFTCPPPGPPSPIVCGNQPDVPIPNDTLDPDSGSIRYLVNAEAMTPSEKPLILTPEQKKCTLELEKIVYTPPNAARDYLLRITRIIAVDILTKGSGMFRTQTKNLIQALADRYNVYIEVQPVFSNKPNIVFMPNMAPMVAQRRIGSLISATYLNLPGFVYNPVLKRYESALYAPNLDLSTGITLIVSVSAESGLFFDCK